MLVTSPEKHGTVRKNRNFWPSKPAVPQIDFNIYGNDLVGKLQASNNQRYYYLKDHLGSVRVTLDQSGNVDSWTDYYPFGKEARGSSTANRPKEQFTGKERDSEIGLDYFGARYYNPDIVRWTSVDPLWEKHPDWTPYNYVLGNPVILIDPDGRQVKFDKVVHQALQTYVTLKEHLTVQVGTGVGAGIGVEVPGIGSLGVEGSIVSVDFSVNGKDEFDLTGTVGSVSGGLEAGPLMLGAEGAILYGNISSSGDPTGEVFQGDAVATLEGGTDKKTSEVKGKVKVSDKGVSVDKRYKKNGNFGASTKVGIFNVGVKYNLLGAYHSLVSIWGDDTDENTEGKPKEDEIQ